MKHWKLNIYQNLHFLNLWIVEQKCLTIAQPLGSNFLEVYTKNLPKKFHERHLTNFCSEIGIFSEKLSKQFCAEKKSRFWRQNSRKMLKNHEKLTLTKNVIFLPVLPFFVILDFAHENSNNFTLILAVKKRSDFCNFSSKFQFQWCRNLNLLLLSRIY